MLAEADRLWEREGVKRRDAEPDRGPHLFLLGLVALLLAPVLGLILGSVVWRLADADIRKMRAGRMHRTGRWGVEHARQFAIGAVVMAAMLYPLVGGVLLWQWLFGP
jgi:hypothetical protein